ncbi:MAG: Rrf2 family transcriptional regulator [Bacillota bacterium]|nr:Rrf2 family transcriptional regulator [Bacillota bacterium]
MKISTKGRYALRMMLDIAENQSNGLVRLKDISERQEISEKYLEQIVSSLVKAGMVKGVRGAQGGYKLSQDPHEYTIGSILRITEGSLAPVACLDDPENSCPRKEMCSTLSLWQEFNKVINEFFDSKTLQDILDEKKECYCCYDYNI